MGFFVLERCPYFKVHPALKYVAASSDQAGISPLAGSPSGYLFQVAPQSGLSTYRPLFCGTLAPPIPYIPHNSRQSLGKTSLKRKQFVTTVADFAIQSHGGAVTQRTTTAFSMCSHPVDSPTRMCDMPPEPHDQALSLILRAYEYAQDADADPWQFALSIRELDASGLTTTDIRWLLLKNYVSLGTETTIPGDAVRSFRLIPFTALNRHACLIVTDSGATLLRQRLSTESTSASPELHPGHTVANPAAGRRPNWDPGRRELRVGQTVVKRFRVPAPNQELVLQVFEEEGWPHSIDDPLPPVLELDAQQRLRATIKSLNRSHLTPLIRFHANGGGQVICWSFLPEAGLSATWQPEDVMCE